MEFIEDFVCVLQMILLTKMKNIVLLVLGLNSKDRKSTRDKANISYPKVNRGCTPLTANRTSADCVQISLGRSIPYIPLGVYRTGRFNAMHQIYLPTTKTITWLIQCLRFNIVIYRLYQSITSRLYSAIPFWGLSLISKFYIRFIYIYIVGWEVTESPTGDVE